MSYLAYGSCLCGSTQFTAVLPARWVAHCHCTRCQRAHGAPFVTWAGFGEQDVTLKSPSDTLRWFVTPEGASRGFCARCGSPMFFKSTNFPGELHIARAMFPMELEQLPSSNVFFSTHARWAVDAHLLPAEPEPTWDGQI